MKKKLNPLPATAKIKAIPNTKYVLIDGDHLAILQTPILRDDKIIYLVGLKKGSKPQEIDVDELNKISSK